MNHLKLITSLVFVLLFRLSRKTSDKEIKQNLEDQQEFSIAFDFDSQNSNLKNRLLKLISLAFGSCYFYNTFTGKNNNMLGLHGGDSRYLSHSENLISQIS